MAEPDLLGMYGATTEARDQEAVRARQRAMTHESPANSELAGYQGTTSLGAAAAPLPPTDAETQALIEEAQATQAALDAARPAPEMTSGQVVGGLYGASQGRLANLQAQHAGLGPYAVTRRNPEHKYAQRTGREQLTGDLEAVPPEPPPFVAPQRDPTEGDAAYAMRVDLAREAYDTENALALDEWQRRGVPDARDIGRDGNIGFNEAKRREAERQLAERTAAQARIDTIRTEGAKATREANLQARELNRELQQQREDATTALQQLQKTEQDARAKLDALPAINGQRRTQQMGWGAKLAALGAAFAGGFSGAGSMADELRSQREEDLAEQQLNYDMGVRSYEAARDAASQGLDIFHSVMQGLGDREAGAMTYASMVMEDQIAALQEEEQNAASEELAAQYRQARLQVEEELRANRDATQRYMEANPKNTVAVVDPNRAERRRNEKLQDMEIEHQYDLEKAGIDVASKADDRRSQVELEGIKQQGASRAKLDKHRSDQAYSFGKDVEKIDTAVAGIDELLGKDDIPGYGFTASPFPEALDSDLAATNAQINLVLDELARLKSGAAIGQDEWEMYDGMLRGGTALGGEDRLRENLARVKTFLTNKRNAIERGLEPGTREYYNRNAAAADFDARWTGGPMDSVVEED